MTNLFLIGMAAAIAGVAMLSIPAALITGGLALASGAWLANRAQPDEERRA